MKRNVLLTIYGERYKRLYPVNLEDKGLCFYCGEYATTMDHVPPLAVVENISRLEDHFLVPSCFECNSLAGDEPHTDLEERRDFIRSKLHKKYKSLIRQSAHWYEEEIDELRSEDPESRLIQSISALKPAEYTITDRVKYQGYTFDHY